MSLSQALHKDDALFFIPLGGLGEIGMNLMAIVHRGKAIVLDCGVTFPDNYYPGVDLIVPNIDFFREFKVKVEAIVLTHSHEDHLGAVAFLHKRMGLPKIYATEFTTAMLRPRYNERSSLDESLLVLIEPGKNFDILGFEFEPLRVTHSLVDCIGLAIHTKYGRIVHTGDFKIDRTPLDSWEFDEERFKELGEQGVRLLMSDSTNVESKGWSVSETSLIEPLTKVISEIKTGKIIVTLFSSNIHRIEVLLKVAKACGRKVAMTGRSVLSNIQLAVDGGHLKLDRSLMITPAEVETYEPREVMVLCTGTQAEGRSALSKITSGSHPDIELRQGDTVIFSSRHIPGNEKRIAILMNSIYRAGAKVIDHRDAQVHASGHAREDELRSMLEWVKPDFFLPVHGEYKMLCRHHELSKKVNPNIGGFVAENGDVLRLDANSFEKFLDRVPAGKVFLDEARNVVPEKVVRERRKLANEGLVIIGAVLKKKRFEPLQGPDIYLVGLHEDVDLLELEGQLSDLFDDFRNASQIDLESLDEEIRVVTRRFFRRAVGLKPRVIPNIYVI